MKTSYIIRNIYVMPLTKKPLTSYFKSLMKCRLGNIPVTASSHKDAKVIKGKRKAAQFAAALGTGWEAVKLYA